MALVTAAVKGKMGSVEYYTTKMRVRELVTGVRPANQLDEWSDMSIEERMQREPDLKRIEKEIAPYVAQTEDRFFGSLVVLVYKGEITFEPLDTLVAKIPKAYQAVGRDIGFLTIDGGVLIVLDGQHRYLALDAVLKNRCTGPYARQVPDDEVSVIFIHHESNERTRRIFNKLNRYAKTTSRADNIITSEDDGYAIIARRLLQKDSPLGPVDSDQGEADLVDWTNNTLAARSTKLTTMSVVYDSVKIIVNGYNTKLDEKIRPSEQELDRGYERVAWFWSVVLNGIETYRRAVEDVSSIPAMRAKESEWSLLHKPVAQIALFKALVSAVRRGLDLEEAVERCNHINWSMDEDIWRDIIVRQSGRIDARAEAKENMARMVEYLIAGDRMSGDEIHEVLVMYNRVRGNEEDSYEELPDPVAQEALF